jgi:hypothetical protein
MSRRAFYKLVSVIFPEEVVRRGGRKFALDNQGKLGLTLFYLGSKMETKFLSLLFGVSPSTISLAVGTMHKFLTL